MHLTILKKSIFLYILPLVTYYLLSVNLISGNIGKGRFIMAFIATDTSESNIGAYNEIADYKRYYSLISTDEKTEMSLGKFSSELYYNYFDYLKLLVRKSNRLYQLGDDYSWTRNNEPGRFFQMLVSVMWGVNKLARIFLYSLAIAGLFYLFKRVRLAGPYSLVLLNWMMCSLLLIFLGEVSPRYSYLFLVALPVLAAAGFIALPGQLHELRNSLERNRKKSFRSISEFAVFIVLAGFLIAGFGLIFRQKMKDSDLVYRDLRERTLIFYKDGKEVRLKGLSPEVTPQEAPLKSGIILPAGSDSVTSEWKFGVQPGADYEVRGFIRENMNREQGVITQIVANGREILPADHKKPARKRLKKKTDYTVAYFSSVPQHAVNDTMTIRLVLANPGYDQNIEIQPNTAAETCLEFLQVIRTDRK